MDRECGLPPCRYIMTLFAIDIELTTTQSFVGVVPSDDVTRLSLVETDASLLEQQMKIRNSKIIDVTLSSFYRVTAL